MKCHLCGTSRSRHKNNTSIGTTSTKRVLAKILRYFPLGLRLKTLYMSCHTSELMVWHSEKRPRDEILQHPTDSRAWAVLDKIDSDFGFEG